MDRDFIHEFGSIAEHNYNKAISNFKIHKGNLDSIVDDMGAYLDAIDNEDGMANSTQTYYLMKSAKQLMAIARLIEVAAEDVDATAKGLFPGEIGEVKKIGWQDPRDWFFNFVNKGDCHDCPLHDHLDKDGYLPCGARKCIVSQLCELIGR